MRRMRALSSLTSRLVLTAVALVALVCLLVGLVTTLGMRSYLINKLDTQVTAAADRTTSALSNQHEAGPGPGLGSEIGGVTGVYADNGNSVALLTTTDPDSGVPLRQQLSQAATTALGRVPTDGQVHAIKVPGAGGYRVVASKVDGGRVVVGLPDYDVHETVMSMVRWELLMGLLCVGAAGGAGLFLVRRQLRPLREVAETAHTVAALPLASGDVGVTSRVPERLTDEATEVGQVGSALNMLLEHVETSLAARHRSEQQVRQFVADASHELRTPLTTIRGYTELARRRPDDSAASATALAKVEEESARMTALVEDLLLLARLDQGRPLEREPVDLSRMLVEAVSDARVVAPDHRWVVDLPEEPVELTGDEMRLHQVVANLLSNARNYTPPGTTVTVRGWTGGFAVHDDGPGFPPSLVPVAFERFTRGDAARSRGRDSGAGLGLSLVDAIVSAHGGVVALTSKPGDTTITVRLSPSAPPIAASVVPQASASAVGPLVPPPVV